MEFEEPYISSKRDDEYNTVLAIEKRYKLQRLERTNGLCYNIFTEKKKPDKQSTQK